MVAADGGWNGVDMPQPFTIPRGPASADGLRHPHHHEDPMRGSTGRERSDGTRKRVSVADHRYAMPIVREIPPRQF